MISRDSDPLSDVQHQILPTGEGVSFVVTCESPSAAGVQAATVSSKIRAGAHLFNTSFVIVSSVGQGQAPGR